MMKKVIHILLGKANPNRMNGVNKVVNSLATYQKREGIDVQVWGITKSPKSATSLREYDLKLFKSRGVFSLDKLLMLEISKENKDTIFHIHGAFSIELTKVAKHLKKFHHRYIYTSHGAFNVIAMKRSFWKKKIYTFLFESRIVRNAYKLHFIGLSEIAGAKKIFKTFDYFLVPNGQDIMEFIPDKSNLIEKKKVFGFIGRLDIKTKGIDILVDAISTLNNDYKNKIEFWFIGGGKGQKYLQRKISKESLQGCVKLLGPKFGIEKLDLMNRMDFLCLNSRNEGLPGVVLEGLAQGVPAIISIETNLGDFITSSNAGFVLKKNDANELKEAIIGAIIQPKKSYIEMSKSALKLIEDEFDWKIIAKKMIAHYG